ncbi:ankyrin repeat domain-containing protein 16-like isoform X2 [Leptotrombidium deliense]|uniref:Alpha-latrotoxin n=1 Tax=Leptotrombidium deliense TaxID=299467 RepID=A0A443SVM0_9ACAR|nr:ankyrin repeat domain-containing protein 16-like isoform X2 [Leptotrombidium deliense]
MDSLSKQTRVLFVKNVLKAIRADSVESLRTCLQSTSVNVSNAILDANSNTAIHCCARFTALECLRYLIHREKSDINVDAVNKEGKTALHEAAIIGNADIVKLLLSNGWNVDAIKRGDWTPLMLAVASSHFEVVKILIEIGRANTRLVNKDGWNCFHLAARSGNLSIVRFLLHFDNDLCKNKSYNNRTPLHSCALQGHYSVAQHLITNECVENVDEIDVCGNTPFIEAIISSCTNICRLLIAHNCDPLITDSLQRNALHIAAECNAVESVVYLITELHFTVDKQCPRNGFTALHYAAKEGHENVIRVLKQFHCDLSIRDNKQRLPSDIAITFKHNHCVHLLN